jgi:hypothetical protein
MQKAKMLPDPIDTHNTAAPPVAHYKADSSPISQAYLSPDV